MKKKKIELVSNKDGMTAGESVNNRLNNCIKLSSKISTFLKKEKKRLEIEDVGWSDSSELYHIQEQLEAVLAFTGEYDIKNGVYEG